MFKWTFFFIYKFSDKRNNNDHTYGCNNYQNQPNKNGTDHNM